MMRKAWLVLSAVLLLNGIGVAQLTQPQQQQRQEDYSIRGKIVVGNVEGDLHIEVRLEKATTQVIGTSYTDSAGNFEFRNSLGPGQFQIVVNLEGYEPTRQSVELYTNMRNASVTVFLNRVPLPRSRPTGLDAADPDVIDVSQMKERFPKKAIQNYEKAIEEKKKGETLKAIKLLEEAVLLAPKFYHAHNNLGILYQKLKRYGEAEKEYKVARQLNSKNAQPMANLGSLYIEEADLRKKDGEEAVGKLLDQALDVLEQAVKTDPHSAVSYYYLGSANYKSAFFEEAEAALKKALDLDPNMGIIRLMLANVYMKQSRWRSVVEHLDAYLQENPKADNRAAIEEMRSKIAKGLDAPAK